MGVTCVLLFLEFRLKSFQFLKTTFASTWVVFAAGNCHFEILLPLCSVHFLLCQCTLISTKANSGFVLYEQSNKTTSLSHQLQINKTHVAYHFCFYLPLQKRGIFNRTNLNLYLPKMLQSKKLTTTISSQTEFTMSRRLLHIIIFQDIVGKFSGNNV